MYFGGFSWEATGKMVRPQRLALQRIIREFKEEEAKAANPQKTKSRTPGTIGTARVRGL